MLKSQIESENVRQGFENHAYETMGYAEALKDVKFMIANQGFRKTAPQALTQLDELITKLEEDNQQKLAFYIPYP